MRGKGRIQSLLKSFFQENLMAFIAKLSHYLDDDLSLIKLPAPAVAI
jgi:hypothetical protein